MPQYVVDAVVDTFPPLASIELHLKSGLYILTGPPGSGKTILSKLLYAPVAMLLMLKRGVENPGRRVLRYILPGVDQPAENWGVHVEVVYGDDQRISFRVTGGSPRLNLEPPRAVREVTELHSPVILLSEERVASVRSLPFMGGDRLLLVDPATHHLVRVALTRESGFQTRLEDYARILGVKPLRVNGSKLFIGDVPLPSESSTRINLALISIAFSVVEHLCSPGTLRRLIVIDMPEYGLTHRDKLNLVEAASHLLSTCRGSVVMLISTHDEILYRLVVRRLEEYVTNVYLLKPGDGGFLLEEWRSIDALPPQIMEGIRLVARDLLHGEAHASGG